MAQKFWLPALQELVQSNETSFHFERKILDEEETDYLVCGPMPKHCDELAEMDNLTDKAEPMDECSPEELTLVCSIDAPTDCLKLRQIVSLTDRYIFNPVLCFRNSHLITNFNFATAPPLMIHSI